MRIVFDLLRTVIPQQPKPVTAEPLVASDRQTIQLDFLLNASGSHFLGERVDVVPANGIGFLQKLLAELLVFLA